MDHPAFNVVEAAWTHTVDCIVMWTGHDTLRYQTTYRVAFGL